MSLKPARVTERTQRSCSGSTTAAGDYENEEKRQRNLRKYVQHRKRWEVPASNRRAPRRSAAERVFKDAAPVGDP